MAEERQRQARDITEFQSFAKKVAVKVPQSNNSYRSSYGRYRSAVSSEGFTHDEIRMMLESGDPETIRELSKYFVRFSGTYGRPL
ncbi:MAG: hypothetical protein IKB97_05480 [Bacteroidaceae bacterium]|jgi:inactivated superfamily I helicase|nr:hypothetical protein [Bacteroidaceae bacterium]